MLLLAAVIFVAGHGQAFLLALASLSPATLSTVAATALVAAALWSEAAERVRRRSKQALWAARQAWDVVEALVAAVLKLPDCARDINVVLHEMREVNFELKVIRSKIRFLPGQPKDSYGRMVSEPVRPAGHPLHAQL